MRLPASAAALRLTEPELYLGLVLGTEAEADLQAVVGAGLWLGLASQGQSSINARLSIGYRNG